MNDVASIYGSRREHLKQATLELHRRVERVVEANGYFDDRSKYGRWLLASLAFHRAAYANVCSATVASCLGAGAIAERLELIERDLANLDIVVPSARMATAEREKDAAETLGVFYVTEGASLGARVLYTRIRRLGLGEAAGAGFLARQAHDLQGWRGFVTALDAFQGSADQDQRLLRSSCATFELAAFHYGAPP
jgi:heme oxygenase